MDASKTFNSIELDIIRMYEAYLGDGFSIGFSLHKVKQYYNPTRVETTIRRKFGTHEDQVKMICTTKCPYWFDRCTKGNTSCKECMKRPWMEMSVCPVGSW